MTVCLVEFKYGRETFLHWERLCKAELWLGEVGFWEGQVKGGISSLLSNKLFKKAMRSKFPCTTVWNFFHNFNCAIFA